MFFLEITTAAAIAAGIAARAIAELPVAGDVVDSAAVEDSSGAASEEDVSPPREY